jgi:hypothetical protein
VLQERFSRGIRPPTIPELATWDICSGSWHIARDRTRLLAQARHFTLRSEGLFIAWLCSPKKQQSRRFLKRSDPLFGR